MDSIRKGSDHKDSDYSNHKDSVHMDSKQAVDLGIHPIVDDRTD